MLGMEQAVTFVLEYAKAEECKNWGRQVLRLGTFQQPKILELIQV